MVVDFSPDRRFFSPHPLRSDDMKLELLRTEKTLDTFWKKACTPGSFRPLDNAGRQMAQSPNPASRSMKYVVAVKMSGDICQCWTDKGRKIKLCLLAGRLGFPCTI